MTKKRGSIRSLPPGEKHPHGTRARYVGAKCRCDECRAANAAYYHERQAIARAAATELSPEPTAGFMHSTRDVNGKKRVRVYKKGCPGVEGKPCPHYSYLRKDSIGGVCGKCRVRLSYNGLVDAKPVRKHLRKLSRRGVGYKQVADAACVSLTVTAKVLSGEKKQVRADTAKKILAVDIGAKADHSLVDAKATWKLIRQMLNEDYTKRRLAQELGFKSPALQIGKKKILARTALAVEKVHKRLMT